MPREWGRDPFYTFLPRERNEGAGKVNAIMLKGEWKSVTKPFSTGLAWGYYDLPDVKDYRLNKYGMPAYHQVNHETSWKPKGVLTGFELKTLIAWKIGSGDTYGDPKYVYNKTEMVNFNLILEFKL
jgi:hypothetical protein